MTPPSTIRLIAVSSRLLATLAAAVVVIAACGSSNDGDAGDALDDPAGGSIAAETSTAAVAESEDDASTSQSASSSVDGATDESSTALSVTSVPGSPASTTSAALDASTSSSSSSTEAPAGSTSTSNSTETTATGGGAPGSPETVRIRFESLVPDVTTDDLASEALTVLNDPRGWIRAGFTFVADENAPYRVVLAEGPTVDELCLPLMTYSKVSCQNGPVVALNADRWRSAVPHWELGVEVYRGYLVNHEVGHLIGQRHPKPRCPVAGRPAGVMEQQTAGLEGCVGNPWPRDWEITHAQVRPVVYAPLPDWGPDPVPSNGESNASADG